MKKKNVFTGHRCSTLPVNINLNVMPCPAENIAYSWSREFKAKGMKIKTKIQILLSTQKQMSPQHSFFF